jgi:Tfp pilus assembly protein PilX
MNKSMQHIHQRGSALIVSMVFLIILTILGISTMTTSRVEIRMAVNQQSADQAFQASASGIDQTLSQTNIFDTNAAAGINNTFYYRQTVGGPFTNGTNNFMETVNTNTLFEVTAPPPGFSLGSKVTAFHFRILSTGNSVAGSESQQVQGFYKIGPG